MGFAETAIEKRLGGGWSSIVQRRALRFLTAIKKYTDSLNPLPSQESAVSASEIHINNIDFIDFINIWAST